MDDADRNIERAIGSLQESRNATNARLASIEDKLDKLAEQMAVASGGLRTLIAVGSISATVGAGLSSLAHWLFFSPK